MIRGDVDGGLETFVDSLPVVGHIKGAIQALAGDEERGVQIIKGKSVQ